MSLMSAGLLAELDFSLAPLCTYKVGGAASIFVEVHDVEELADVAEIIAEFDLQILIIGKGSNLLVSDSGFRGLVIQLGSGFDFVDIDQNLVKCGAITFLPIVARKSAAASLKGFEWAVGVPGSVGGAVRMNAGGHGSDMAESLVTADVFDLKSGNIDSLNADGLELGYRKSALLPHQLVVGAIFELEPGIKEESEAEISNIVKWRRANQPGGQNAGSVFANPDGDHAARLIDNCGLKGFRVGTAEVSTKHANFIQADRDGKADDVYALIKAIQEKVYSETGFELRPENKLIGFD